MAEEKKTPEQRPLTDKERVELYYGVKIPDRSPERMKEIQRFWIEWQENRKSPKNRRSNTNH